LETSSVSSKLRQLPNLEQVRAERAKRLLASRPSIVEALEHPGLFGGLPAFKDLRSWRPWLTFLGALYGLPLSGEEEKLFCKHTGLKSYDPPEDGYHEAVVITGVQSGKSRIAATIAVYEGLIAEPEPDGTKIFSLVLAQDARGAVRGMFSYASSPFDSLRAVGSRVVNRTANTLELNTGVIIAAYPCRPASIRGIRARLIVLDEFAFYIGAEGATTDLEMLRAARGRLATTNGRLVVISSPYGETGALWELKKAHFGKKDSPVLVWQATAPEMNPTLPRDYIARMRVEDPDGYRSEVMGEFRAGVSTAFDRESVEACLAEGPIELAPKPGIPYAAFVDPSGGRDDAFTLAIGHKLPPHGRAVVDCVRSWPAPFNPSGIVAEAAGVLKRYRVGDVWGDKYAGEWPREAFREHSIDYNPCEAPKSDLYLSFIAATNAQTVELPNMPELVSELLGLQRRRGSAGRDKIDHRPGGHDDVANSVAGLCAMLLSEGGANDPHVTWI
jgi:hypothetical protein